MSISRASGAEKSTAKRPRSYMKGPRGRKASCKTSQDVYGRIPPVAAFPKKGGGACARAHEHPRPPRSSRRVPSARAGFFLYIYLSISTYLSIYISIYIYISLSLHLLIYLYLSVYLFVSLSLSLSIYLPYLSSYRGCPSTRAPPSSVFALSQAFGEGSRGRACALRSCSCASPLSPFLLSRSSYFEKGLGGRACALRSCIKVSKNMRSRRV